MGSLLQPLDPEAKTFKLQGNLSVMRQDCGMQLWWGLRARLSIADESALSTRSNCQKT